MPSFWQNFGSAVRYIGFMPKAPKGKRLEDALDRLRALASQGDDASLLPELKRALVSGSAPLAKKAAEVAARRELRGLHAELEDALSFFLRHPEDDRGCVAKEPVARALLEEDDSNDELWLAAARHVQMEGSFGPPVDAAAELRGIAAAGVAQSSLPNKVHVLIDLLLDASAAARAGAVRALAFLGNAEALSLLRYKTLLGDAESAVMGECFHALLAEPGSRRENVPLVAGFLRAAHEGVAEEAALALGECRDPLALPVLTDALHHNANPSFRGTLLRALAMLRSEQAYAVLAEFLRDASPSARQQALRALAIFQHEPELAFLFE